MGSTTIGDLAAADEGLLVSVLGRMGATLHGYAAGLDDAPVRRQGESDPVKSVGNGMTFRRDLVGLADVRVGAGHLAEEVAARLRRAGLFAGALGVSIKDPALHTITRQKQLERPTDLASELTAAALALIGANWDLRRPIRALTLTAFSLSGEDAPVQTTLFEDPAAPRRQRRRRLEQTLDGLRGRYGADVVLSAGVLGSDLGLAGEQPPEGVDDPRQKKT